VAKRFPKWPTPDAIERKYRGRLREIVAKLRERVEDELIARLPMLVAEHGVRADSWVDDIERAVTAMSMSLDKDLRDAQREALDIGNEVSEFNKRQMREIMRRAVGVNVMRSEPWLEDELRSFASENAKLIKSLPESSLSEIEGLAQRGVRSGQSASEISKAIRDKLGATQARADLIARDQVSKLNGQLTKKRQEAVGIATYQWLTSRDERVRASHRAMGGKLCRWDDDSVYSDDGGKTWKSRSSIGGYVGHPGDDYQCRCVGTPNTDAILQEA